MSDTTKTATKAPVLVEYRDGFCDLLRSAFNQICDPDDWRGPIDCLVPRVGASIYVEAIRFMTATDPTCEYVVKDGMQYARLKSIGYRAGPAGA